MELVSLDNLEHDIKNLNDDEILELIDQINYEYNNNTRNDKKKSDNHQINIFCDTCNTGDKIFIDYNQGILVCTGCGTIIENILDENPEWRQYGSDIKNDKSRCNFPTNNFLPQSSLGTSIACSNKSKIKTLHNWSAMPYKERSLHLVLKEIQNRCRKANILKCIEDDAKILYKNISECRHINGKNKGKYIIIRGVNRKGLIAACVFYACLRKGHTRSPKEIANVFELKYTDITKGCKTFIKLIKIKKLDYEFHSSSPEHFIQRFCKELHIKKEFVDQAIKIARNIQKLNIASVHTPLSKATASILLMADINNIPITKKLISKQFKISEVTIMKTYKKIESYKKILINDELTNKIINILNKEKINLEIPEKLKKKYEKLINTNKESNQNLSFVKTIHKFDIRKNSLEDYINSIEINLNNQIKSTDKDYNLIINEFQKYRNFSSLIV